MPETKKNLYSKRNINACLNAVDCLLGTDRFKTPYETLTKVMTLFFDDKDRHIGRIEVNPETNQLIVTDVQKKVLFTTGLKQDFVDRLYPKEKELREQIPGQLTIEEYLTPPVDRELSISDYMTTLEEIDRDREEARNGYVHESSYRDEINESYEKDDWFIEEQDR